MPWRGATAGPRRCCCWAWTASPPTRRRHGRRAAEAALSLAAARLACALRAADRVYHSESDRFAVLAPETDAAGALALGLRLVETVAEANCPHTESPWGVLTASAGIAVLAAHRSPEAALCAARRRLLQAKRAGGCAVAAPGVLRRPPGEGGQAPLRSAMR
ncbi:MAG: hypothetical protein KatS3mg121_0245 [Gammaproteobacteria bacterium]|nr:MAG: hypothetical protein KatS3mg121_0245 [Gammaproteobacteria bacterium]